MSLVPRLARILANSFGVVALALLFIAPLAGQPAPTDPVERLDQVLHADSKTPADLDRRKKALEELTSDKQLKDADLPRALSLDAWKDLDKVEAVAAVDEPVRKKLVERFKKWLTGVLRQKGKDTIDSRLAAIALLSEMGANVRRVGEKKRPVAAELAAELAALLKDPDAAIREAAARALGKIVAEPKAATKALGELLINGDAGGRRAAAEGLAKIVIILLPIAQSKTSSPSVDIDRAEALLTTELVAQTAGLGLRDDDPAVRRHCLQAIGTSGRLLGEMGEVLARELPPSGRSPTEEEKAKGDQFRTNVKELAKEVRPLAEAVTGQMAGVVRALGAADVTVCLAANQALEDIAGARATLLRQETTAARLAENAAKAKPPADVLETLATAVPELAKLLSHKEVRVRLAAIYVLETLEGMAAPVAGELAKALADSDPFVRWGAARALGNMAPAQTATAVPALAKVLDDDNGDVRVTASAALERYGPAAKGAVAELAKAANQRDVESRLWAIRALAAMGKDGQPAVAGLATALAATEPQVRLAAAKALGKMGPVAKEAAPALRKALDDSNADVRRAASEALLAIIDK